MTSLHQACAEKNIITVKKLLEEKAISNTNAIDHDGNTALHIACKVENLDIVKILLEHNADVNAKNHKGQTPLYMLLGINCFYHGSIYLKITETLLKHNADPNTVDHDGKTPIVIACENDDLTMVKTLMEHNGDIDWRNSEGKTFLHLTTILYASHIFRYLLTQGADINRKCDDDKTVLDYLREMIFSDGFVKGQGEEIHKYQICYCIRMFRRTRIQLIKLKCAGLKVSQHNVSLIYSDNEYQDVMSNLEHAFSLESVDTETIEGRCKEEIANLMCVNVSYVTLYNILADYINNVSRLVRNKARCEEIERVLHLDRIEQRFPLYADVLRSRFKEAITRNELFEAAENYSVPTIFRGLALSCVREIFTYLDNVDLKVFVSVVKMIRKF